MAKIPDITNGVDNLNAFQMPQVPTKDDEVKFLDLLQNFYPADSYLHELFNERFISEMQSRIHNDFPCDIESDLRYTKNDLDEAKESYRKLHEDKLKDLDAFSAKLDEWKNLAETLSKEKQAVLNARAEDQNVIFDLQCKNGELLAALEKKEAVIKSLKAEIYDLTHKEK